jgi:hypothetical protein
VSVANSRRSPKKGPTRSEEEGVRPQSLGGA